MGKGKIFLYLCLSFVGGVFISSFISVPSGILWGFFILGIVSTVAFWQDKRFMIFGAALILAVFGIYHHQARLKEISQIARYNDEGEVAIRGIISRDPEVRLKSAQLVIDIDEIEIGEERTSISGNVLVITARYPEYRYGDEVVAGGKLTAPTDDLDGFDYRSFLAKDGIYSLMYLPEIGRVSSGNGNWIIAKILVFKHALRDSIFGLLPSPEAELLIAILLGDERRLSPDLIEKFNTTGTRHIMAISGMNITIISQIILAFFLAIALSRKQAFVATIVVLSLFIILVGAPASVVRAGIMAGALLLAQNLGRPKSEMRAVIYAALLMLIVNPLILRVDTGFQLSFLAVLGIILFGNYIKERFRVLPTVFGIRDAASFTVAAQLTTFPMLLFAFGRLSLVSVPANILIVSLLPFLMIGGFVSGLAGMVWEPLGTVLSWVLWVPLRYMVTVVHFFAEFSFASITLIHVPWLAAVFYYLPLFWFWNRRVRRWSPDADHK